jgi:hypothetical protein
MNFQIKLVSGLLLNSFFFALIFACGCSSITAERSRVYFNREHSFSLVLPHNWTETKSGGQQAIASFVPQKHHDIALLSINLMQLQPEQAKRLAGLRTNRSFCALLSLGILSTKIGKIINREMITIDGSPGCALEISGKIAGIKTRTLITVLLSRQRIVSLSFATKENIFPGYVEEVRSILRSFHDYSAHPLQKSI